MQPGGALVSAIGHIGVHLWQLDATQPTSVISRSYAIVLGTGSRLLAAEYGSTVAPE
jgi:hypothetical protein